jgi:LEA14-like dessication related protein
MKKWITPLLVLAALLVSAGCRSTGDLIGTGLIVDLVKIQQTGPDAYVVTWRLENPNIVPYVIDHSLHRLAIDGAPVGTLEEKDRFGVAPQTTVEHSIALTLNGAAAKEKMALALASGKADYHLDSTAWLLLVDDELTKYTKSRTGTVPVVAK